MEEKNYSGVIPENYTGKIIDVVESIELPTEEEAKAFFAVVKTRLLNVNDWHEVAGTLTAKFQLVNEKGEEVYRPVQQGDYFEIDIPGPGPAAGEGYDWVRVEEVQSVSESAVESVGIRVRPTTSPWNSSDEIAHFYAPESTSSFTVTREGTKVTAGIYDRNTKPNTEGETVVEQVRNTVVGTGAVTAFSRVQWKSLAEGLLKKEPEQG